MYVTPFEARERVEKRTTAIVNTLTLFIRGKSRRGFTKLDYSLPRNKSLFDAIERLRAEGFEVAVSDKENEDGEINFTIFW